MEGLVKPMQLYPELKKDFISRRLKHVLFTGIVLLHVGIFILPALWYFFRQWLKPDEKVISVSLVDFPSADPRPGGGGAPGAGERTETAAEPPPLPDVKPLDNSIPDVPDIPDVPQIRYPKPVPQERPVVRKEVPKTTPAPPKAKPAPVKRRSPVDMVEQIRRQRAQNRKHLNSTRKGTSSSSSRSTNAAAQRQKMLRELAAQMRNAGSGGGAGSGTGRGRASGAGTGGIYDPTLSELLRLIDRYWVDPQISSGASPEPVLIAFEIDGRGGIAVRSAQRSGDPAIDASVAQLLKKLQTMRIAPPEGRRSKSYTVRLRIREE